MATLVIEYGLHLSASVVAFAAILGTTLARRLTQRRGATAPPTTARSWSTAFVAGLALAGVGTAGVYGLGEIGLRSIPGEPAGGAIASDRLDRSDLMWAATSPWHRDAALRAFIRALGAAAPQNEALARERLALAEMSGGCRDALRVATAHGLDDEALTIAARCDSEVAAAALCRARPEDAAAVLSQSDADLHAESILAFGDLRLAADAAHARAHGDRRRAEAAHGDDPLHERQAQGWAIYAHAIDARRGDREARAQLEACASSTWLCRLLLADLAESSERIQRASDLMDEARGQLVPRHPELALVLLSEADPEHAAQRLADLPALPQLPASGAEAPRPGLREALAATAAIDATPAVLRLRAFLRGLRALELTSQSRHAEAAEFLRAGRRELNAATAADGALPGVHGWWRATEASIVAAERSATSSLPAALTDGVDVAQRFHPESALWDVGRASDLARLQTGQTALATHLRWAPSRWPGCLPARQLAHASREAALAAVLSDQPWLDAASAEVRRLDEAMTRREVAMLVYLTTEPLVQLE